MGVEDVSYPALVSLFLSFCLTLSLSLALSLPPHCSPSTRYTDAQAVAYYSLPFYAGSLDTLPVSGAPVRLYDEAARYINVVPCLPTF